jgi:hypothetical protein
MTAAAPYRWHSSPDYRLRDSRDCITGHQRRTAALVHELCAYIGHRLHDSDLPRWVLVHDEAERLTGDVPAHAKRRWGYLAEALERAEAEARRELGIPDPDLTPIEWQIMKLCDRLDAYIWAKRLNCTDTPEWQADLVRLHKMAWAISGEAAEWLSGKVI